MAGVWRFCEIMARSGEPDFFETEKQHDLFGAEAAPAYRPDPDRVRSRLSHGLFKGPLTRNAALRAAFRPLPDPKSGLPDFGTQRRIEIGNSRFRSGEVK
jgi:hypothetical protein